jgi:hypothetical protein
MFSFPTEKRIGHGPTEEEVMAVASSKELSYDDVVTQLIAADEIGDTVKAQELAIKAKALKPPEAPTRVELESQLIEADKAGDTATAQNLAVQLDKIRQAEAPSPGPLAFANQAIAESLGYVPGQLAKGMKPLYDFAAEKFDNITESMGIPWLPNPYRGMQDLTESMSSKGIKNAMRFIGAETPEKGRQPKTALEYIGRTLGEVSVSINVAGGVTKKLAQDTANLTGKIADRVWKTMLQHPWMTMTTEVTSGVGYGVGTSMGEEAFPDTPGAKETTGMVGGVAGGVIPTALPLWQYGPRMLNQGKYMLDKLSLPFTEKGATYRAGQFVKGLVSDPGKTISKMREPSVGELPPVVRAGEKKLVGLWRGLMGKDPVVDAEAIESISRSMIKLEGELRKQGYGAPEILQDVTSRRITALEMKMDKRILNAADKAQTTLERIPVAKRQSVESQVVERELRGAMQVANVEKKALWRQVDKNLEIGSDNVRAKYSEELSKLSEAQLGDMPTELKSSSLVRPLEEGESSLTKLKEVQGLRSKMLEVAREASASGKENTARICHEIADACLADMDIVARQAQTPEAADLQAALAATHKFKEQFRRGIVGQILGTDRTGNARIDPRLVLDVSVGRSGTRGVVDIEKVVVSPEAVAATERYLARSFTDQATEMGTRPFDPRKAEKWIANNADILDKFPEFRARLSNAAEAQKVAMETASVMEARKAAIRDPKQSIASRFLNAPVEEEIGTIFKSRNPVYMTRQLMLQASKDPTGAAQEGLRSGFVEHILNASRTGGFNDVGEKTLSGRKLLGYLNENQSVLKEAFSPEQITRMRKVGAELVKLDTMMSTEPISLKGLLEIEDYSSGILRLVSRVGGAQLGRVIARWTGGGTVQTPGIFSERFQHFAARLNKDRASQLVHDAIVSGDGKLLEALLLPIEKPGVKKEVLDKNFRILNDRINAWLAGAGVRVWEDIEAEIMGEQQ